ncbi:MAG: bacterial Ig-like domain-containing protein [Clostridia bacterium]|nr:bacterial Ig-like domain-containing protein [Clostridia bacterium]
MTATVLLRIVEKKAVSLVPEEEKLPTVLFEGKPFPSGITFTAEMEDGTFIENIPLDVSYLDGFDPMQLGEQEITISYAGAKKTFRVTVKQEEITDVVLENVTSINTEYPYGAEAPCLDGMRLRLEYDSGRSAYMNVMLSMVSGFDASKSGERSMTVRFGEFDRTFSYRVSRAPCAFVLDEDLVTVMEKGTPLSGYGTLYYDDESSERIPLSSENAPDYSSATAGYHVVAVTVEGFSDDYCYTVLPSIERYEVSYTEVVKVGSSLNVEDALHVFYETGEDEALRFDSDRLTVELHRFDTAGDVAQKVSFRTLELVLPVHVCTEEEWNAVDHIEVSGQVLRELTEGENLEDEDFEGVEVIVVYSHLDPVKVALDPAWVTVTYPTEPLEEDVDLTITVSCYGKTNADLTVRMKSTANARRVTGLYLFGLHSIYAVGDTLPLDEAYFVAEYGDGYAYGDETPLSQADEVFGFSTAETAESATLSVTYQGYVATHTYSVISREEAEKVTMTEVFGMDQIIYVGDTIDDVSLDDIRIAVTYGDGYRTEQLVPTEAEGGPFTSEGNATVVFVSGSYRANYIITVYPREG